MPLYHPAAALRNGDLRPAMHADFARIRELLDGAPVVAASAALSAPPSEPPPPVEAALSPTPPPTNAPATLVDYSEPSEPDPKPQERLL